MISTVSLINIYELFYQLVIWIEVLASVYSHPQKMASSSLGFESRLSLALGKWILLKSTKDPRNLRLSEYTSLGHSHPEIK